MLRVLEKENFEKLKDAGEGYIVITDKPTKQQEKCSVRNEC